MSRDSDEHRFPRVLVDHCPCISEEAKLGRFERLPFVMIRPRLESAREVEDRVCELSASTLGKFSRSTSSAKVLAGILLLHVGLVQQQVIAGHTINVRCAVATAQSGEHILSILRTSIEHTQV
jgi:hypothetical protein